MARHCRQPVRHQRFWLGRRHGSSGVYKAGDDCPAFALCLAGKGWEGEAGAFYATNLVHEYTHYVLEKGPAAVSPLVQQGLASLLAVFRNRFEWVEEGGTLRRYYSIAELEGILTCRTRHLLTGRL